MNRVCSVCHKDLLRGSSNRRHPTICNDCFKSVLSKTHFSTDRRKIPVKTIEKLASALDKMKF